MNTPSFKETLSQHAGLHTTENGDIFLVLDFRAEIIYHQLEHIKRTRI